MITNEAINEFLGAVNAMLAKHYGESKFGAVVSAQPGKKYVRIVRHDTFEGKAREGGSAFCFLDIETGAILKSASWATPAKGNRGNIANGAADLTAYGAVYLR
jgi:hypothetical protein